jgi:phage baseplate assembly protein gpV
MRKFVILAVLLAALPASAQVESIQQIFEKFGLIGVWSPACGDAMAAPGETSEAIYALSHSDGVILTYDNGAGHRPSSYRILSARLETKDRMAYEEERLSDQARATVTLVKVKGAISVLSSVKADGTVLVQGGRVLANGQPTPRRARCRI